MAEQVLAHSIELTKRPEGVVSYIYLLAMLNDFINAFQSQMHLTDPNIQDTLDEPSSNLKDTLLADTVIRQTIKKARDHLENLENILQEVQEAKGESQQLEETEITIDTPTPDFDFIERDLLNEISEIKEITTSLGDLLQNQADVDDEFAIHCTQVSNMLSEILKEKGIDASSEQIGLGVIKATNIVRRRIALEDRIKRGEKLSEEDTKKIQTPYVYEQCTTKMLGTADSEIDNAKNVLGETLSLLEATSTTHRLETGKTVKKTNFEIAPLLDQKIQESSVLAVHDKIQTFRSAQMMAGIKPAMPTPEPDLS